MEALNKSMKKLRENKRDLKANNERLNKVIEDILLKNLQRRSSIIENQKLKALLKKITNKCDKAKKTIRPQSCT